MADMEEIEMHFSSFIIYRIVIPVLAIIGIILNAICFLVLIRPKLRSIRVNRYFQIMVLSDFLVCIFHIPVTSVMGCKFSSYSETFYFAYFGWTTVNLNQSIGTYVILWLALDRFMAVWMWKRSAALQKRPNVVRNRMIFTFLICFILQFAYFVNGAVYCSNNDPEDVNCENGTWIAVTGDMNNYDQTWHLVYRSLYSVFVRWIPYVLLIVFNFGLVIGVSQRRVSCPNAKNRKRKNDLYLTMTMIGITASSILFSLPIIMYLTFFAFAYEDRCTVLYPEEILRDTGNILQLLEHVIHTVFLFCLNRSFRDELKAVFCCIDSEASSPSIGTTDEGDESAV